MRPIQQWVQNLLLSCQLHKKGVVMLQQIKHKIITYIYNISNQPVKMAELLHANILFQDGMKIDGSILGFRLKTGKAYLVFLSLIHIILIPLLALTHNILIHLDCHVAIVIAIIFTAFLFGLFSCFKDWTRDEITQYRIKSMWHLHFPHFPYDEYNQEISNIYKIALQNNILNAELEKYILENLAN